MRQKCTFYPLRGIVFFSMRKVGATKVTNLSVNAHLGMNVPLSSGIYIIFKL